jgi:hypothetical protein
MIESQKFPLESDYTQAYLNDFIIRYFFPKHIHVKYDSFVFYSCVKMLPSFYKLADCSTRRDNVEAFLAENENKVSAYKSALTNCNSELVPAFSLSRSIESSYDAKPSEINFMRFKLKKSEDALEECVKKNMH